MCIIEVMTSHESHLSAALYLIITLSDVVIHGILMPSFHTYRYISLSFLYEIEINFVELKGPFHDNILANTLHISTNSTNIILFYFKWYIELVIKIRIKLFDFRYKSELKRLKMYISQGNTAPYQFLCKFQKMCYLRWAAILPQSHLHMIERGNWTCHLHTRL
jgi:hypothetical protein